MERYLGADVHAASVTFCVLDWFADPDASPPEEETEEDGRMGLPRNRRGIDRYPGRSTSSRGPSTGEGCSRHRLLWKRPQGARSEAEPSGVRAPLVRAPERRVIPFAGARGR
jgi:hypothetical protein